MLLLKSYIYNYIYSCRKGSGLAWASLRGKKQQKGKDIIKKKYYLRHTLHIHQ